MVTNYRGIDAPRSAERGVLMTSPLPAGNVQVAGGEDRFVRGVYIYVILMVQMFRILGAWTIRSSKI